MTGIPSSDEGRCLAVGPLQVATERASPQETMGGGAKGGEASGPLPAHPMRSQRALSPQRDSAYLGSSLGYSSHQGAPPGHPTPGLHQEQYHVQMASYYGQSPAQGASETSQVSMQCSPACVQYVTVPVVGLC